MKKYLVFLLLISCSNLAAHRLKPFTSDGCSSFPDGTFTKRNLWLNCCIAHDKAYWLGGNYEQRKHADNQLKVCVKESGQDEIAALMRAGVRVGGSPFWPTSYRWGYGWEPNKGYFELTANDINLAEQLLLEYEQQQASINNQSDAQ